MSVALRITSNVQIRRHVFTKPGDVTVKRIVKMAQTNKIAVSHYMFTVLSLDSLCIHQTRTFTRTH